MNIIVQNYKRTKYFKFSLRTYILNFIMMSPFDHTLQNSSTTSAVLANTLEREVEKGVLTLSDIRDILGTWDRLLPYTDIDSTVDSIEGPMPVKGYYEYDCAGNEVEE